MKSPGFTLIEMMVVILIIGIIAGLGVPRFLRSGRIPAQDFISNLNTLVTQAVEQAQTTEKPARVFFNMHARKVEVQTAGGQKVGGSISIPPALEIQDVIINGKSQFGMGVEKATFYFLINPEGQSQEVSMIVLDRSRKRGEYEFYLNPFTSLFRLQ